MVNFDEHQDELNELASEVAELRRIGGMNIVRAAHIAEVNGDNEVAWMLVKEASVMLAVATKVEDLLGIERQDDNANL